MAQAWGVCMLPQVSLLYVSLNTLIISELRLSPFQCINIHYNLASNVNSSYENKKLKVCIPKIHRWAEFASGCKGIQLNFVVLLKAVLEERMEKSHFVIINELLQNFDL